MSQRMTRVEARARIAAGQQLTTRCAECGRVYTLDAYANRLCRDCLDLVAIQSMASPRHTTPRGWTPEQDAELLLLLDAGATITAIARQLGRNRETVRSRARLLREDTTPPITGTWTPDETAALHRMVSQGYGWQTIGKQLHRGAKCCYQKYVKG